MKTVGTNRPPAAFWSVPAAEILRQLNSSPQGLTGADAEKRIKEARTRRLKPKKQNSALMLLLSQFISPLVLLLIFTSVLSSVVSQR
jgi:Mg2+-importing ATPase